MRPSTSAILLLAILAACSSRPPEEVGETSHVLSDSAYTDLQARGEVRMGVDQYTSTHLFDDLPDGGRIELQRNEDDPAAVAQIRDHLQHIARAFAAGDFDDPTSVHGHEMPGTDVMAQKKDAITYSYAPLPRGGEVRVSTSDPEALHAIHAFMAAQRGEHRAGGQPHH
jgi:hypothetical protein